MIEQRQPVLMNGAFSAGRHYFVELLKLALAGQASLFDGLPRAGDEVPNGVIRHNHVMLGNYPAHVPYEEFRCFLEDDKYSGYGHMFFIRDLRDLLISAWNFRCNYSGDVSHLPQHGRSTEYARKLQAFETEEESILSFMEHGDMYGFVPLDRFIEGVMFFFTHPRIHTFSYELVVMNPVLSIKSFCDLFKYNFSADAALAAVTAIPRTGRHFRWVSKFTDNIEQQFKDVAGDALLKLGYEKNKDWTFRDYQKPAQDGKQDLYQSELSSNPQVVEDWLIKAGYRIFFERNVENQDVLLNSINHFTSLNIGDLRRTFLSSEEYLIKYKVRDDYMINAYSKPENDEQS